MEKTSRKAKRYFRSGAIVVVVGAVAGVALTAAGYANRIYQQHEQDRWR